VWEVGSIIKTSIRLLLLYVLILPTHEGRELPGVELPIWIPNFLLLVLSREPYKERGDNLFPQCALTRGIHETNDADWSLG